ncbi:MAG: hypothetical protein ACYTEX_27665 [Planctomycetota bacterium]|jgi:hypothetical protein
MQDLTREQILTANDAGCEKVELPEWGGAVYIRKLSAGEFPEMEAIVKARQEDKVSNKDGLLNICILTMCDAEGKRFFTADDKPQLEQRTFESLQRCADIAMQVNGWTVNEQESMEGN